MTGLTRRIITVVSLLSGGSCFALCSAPAAGATSPLPASDYVLRPLCGAPAPGRAACLAVRLVPTAPAAKAHHVPIGAQAPGPLPASASSGAFGLRPEDLHAAYRLPTEGKSEQTIALVDAYNDPTAEADLKAYDEEFKLPECTKANGCFKQLNEHGESSNLPFPQTQSELEAHRKGSVAEREEAEGAEGWALEISLDVQAAHALCQSCHILLVEASGPAYVHLLAAVNAAVAKGANEVSNSWGGERPPSDQAALNHPGVVITAAAGDSGYQNWLLEGGGFVDYPASSPHVVAVGGTSLRLNKARTQWEAETVWNDGGTELGKRAGRGAGGGGCESAFTAPNWQRHVASWTAVGCGGARSVADVAADADPHTGIAVRDSSSLECKGEASWCTMGGTSLASPIVAAAYALAGGGRGVEYPARTLYENETREAASLHDITSGSNGECLKPTSAEGEASCTSGEEAQSSCEGSFSCLAGAGYDGPSGVGSPNGLGAFQPRGSNERIEGEEAPPGQRTPRARPPEPPAVSYPSLAAPVSATPPAPALYNLVLTRHALAALNRSRPRVSLVSFTYTLTAPATVTLTLTRQVASHRRALWRNVVRPRALAAPAGSDRGHVSGRASLRSGRYQLTLAVAGAAPLSIFFQIG